ETKYNQHWLMFNVFKALPIHECASAYKSGASIKKNADIHKNNSYIVKLDFKNFFSSIKFDALVKHISKYQGENLVDEDIFDIVRISCMRMKDRDDLCLSIGAPSSPVLSNSIMFDFDSEIHAWCLDNGVVYTRYADDLTFSTNFKGLSGSIESLVRGVVMKIKYPALALNDKKTTHLSKKYQRRITGVIINNEGALSLGRDRKREVSSLIHKFSLGILPEPEIFRLQGLLGFAKDVEPLFVAKMREKYNSELIERISRARKVTV
ncbi:MAG: retron St85 family RNA-directed DNA polymerase, partial [Halothiobacillus sp.]